MERINISAIPSQTLNIVLAEQYCTISLYWRQAALYLDLSIGQNVICQGAVCTNRADVIQSPVPGFAGTLHFWDNEGDRPPHWQGLNSRWELLYLAEGEEMPESLRY